MKKINLAEKLALFDEHWQPKIVAAMNDYKIQVVKIHGEFVWHRHADTDDFFLVLSGTLLLDLPEETLTLQAGELFVVPKGVEHRTRAEVHTELLLIEPLGTANTGDESNDRQAAEQRI